MLFFIIVKVTLILFTNIPNLTELLDIGDKLKRL